MKNRKIISVMLVILLTFIMTAVMTGCVQKQQPAADQSTQTQTEQPEAEESAAPAADTAAAPETTQNESEYIGEDKALEIAVADSGLTNDQISNSFVKLDYDDDTGRYEYEVKYYNGSTEYEYDIDAITGEITDKDIDND